MSLQTVFFASLFDTCTKSKFNSEAFFKASSSNISPRLFPCVSIRIKLDDLMLSLIGGEFFFEIFEIILPFGDDSSSLVFRN